MQSPDEHEGEKPNKYRVEIRSLLGGTVLVLHLEMNNPGVALAKGVWIAALRDIALDDCEKPMVTEVSVFPREDIQLSFAFGSDSIIEMAPATVPAPREPSRSVRPCGWRTTISSQECNDCNHDCPWNKSWKTDGAVAAP